MSKTLSLDAVPASAPRSSLYRAIWRWHFYAGLLSVPFMILLAVTGSLYLFKSEINHTAFAYRNVVKAEATPMQPPSRLVDKALAAVPATQLKSYAEPASPTASALVTLKGDAGKTLVYINPYTGEILDTVSANNEFMFVTRKLHSLVYFGTYASYVIEAVAGFALVLVVTGFYLWWPRRQSGGVMTVRGTPQKRIWWRDVHAVTGAFAGVVIFFLAFTGMPWSKFWGTHMQDYASQAGMNYPPALWDDVPSSSIPMSEATTKPGWVMQTAPVPASTPTKTPPIGLDQAVANAHDLGIMRGFEMSVPGDETGVYTAAIYPADLGQERTIHFDQYTGKPLVDLGFKDYGPVGKAIEFGINVHMGQQWGLANQLVMLATCFAIILSSVAAVVMWWKRRPVGRLGVPPYPAETRVYRALWIAAAALGLLFPLTGLAILLMLAFDLLVIRSIPPLRRAFA
ncbi:PepSY-associated TM helix domain-containing protein [Lichenihabitans psoromatis]|uniref:PepSY-associated TM helix domain-containing protein n=1 Tax=Lichenihabitans psoromatis TaxID=2528642 RepID=UPI001FE20B8F|nr:PepSY domain-containing protein [Lichenihabitans psoromatis]